MQKLIHALSAALALALIAPLRAPSPGGQRSQSPAQPIKRMADLRVLASLDPIDTHTHVAKGGSSFYAMLDRFHMHILDILLVDDHDPYRKTMEAQLNDALKVVRESPGHAALCTSFDPSNSAGRISPPRRSGDSTVTSPAERWE